MTTFRTGDVLVPPGTGERHVVLAVAGRAQVRLLLGDASGARWVARASTLERWRHLPHAGADRRPRARRHRLKPAPVVKVSA